QTILDAIEEQGKLDDALRREILECTTKARLEDLYLPYKKRRKTKADIAREAGLEPLLEELIDKPSAEPNELATAYLNAGIEEEKKAWDGRRAIIVDRCALDADLVWQVREEMSSTGTMEASVVAGKETECAKFKDYFEFSEPFDSLRSHRILALLRGESERILQLNLTAGDDD